MINKTSNILFVGAHPDDIELGCAGTAKKLSSENNNIRFYIASKGEFGGNPLIRTNEAKESGKVLGVNEVILGNFKDTYIECNRETINELEKVGENCDIIFIPSPNDTHQDHRNLSMACLSAFRNKYRVLAYEIDSTLPSFHPNIFIDITDYSSFKKTSLECHKSQIDRMRISYESIMKLAYFRGLQIKVPLAESFEAVRYLL